jgi:hypothetical protein
VALSLFSGDFGFRTLAAVGACWRASGEVLLSLCCQGRVVYAAAVFAIVAASGGSGVDVPSWIQAAASIVLAIGVLASAYQLIESRRARFAQAAAAMSERWDSAEMLETRATLDWFKDGEELRDQIAAKYSDPKGSPLDLDILLREPNFFEDLGEMLRSKGIRLSWIDSTMNVVVVDRWTLWQPSAEFLRSLDQRGPPIYELFEFLAKRMDELALDHRSRATRPKTDELLRRVRLVREALSGRL